MTIKELIDSKNIKALMAVYFNLVSEDDNSFLIRAAYRTSKYSKKSVDDFDYRTLNSELVSYFGLNFESNCFGRHTLRIEKTQKINTIPDFFEEIYKQIQMLGFETSVDDYQEAVLMSLFVLRGSTDIKPKYFTVDIYRRNSDKKYLRTVFQILSGISAISQLNLNFREYQKQFIEGTHKRNLQIRIRLGWFWENYEQQLQRACSYKYHVLNDNKDIIITNKNYIGNFADRLVEYLNNVLGEDNQSTEIEKERQRLGLATTGVESRDYNLKTLAGSIFPDECMSCKDRFDTDSRTFKMRGRDKYYFEIHHIIPFSKGKEHDQIDNLAKICPVCHRILTKGRAEEWLQKQTIADILTNSDNAREYVGVLAGSSNINDLVDFVYLKLV